MTARETTAGTVTAGREDQEVLEEVVVAMEVEADVGTDIDIWTVHNSLNGVIGVRSSQVKSRR